MIVTLHYGRTIVTGIYNRHEILLLMGMEALYTEQSEK